MKRKQRSKSPFSSLVTMHKTLTVPLALKDARMLYSCFFATPHHKAATKAFSLPYFKTPLYTSAYEGMCPTNSHSPQNPTHPSPQRVHGLQCTHHPYFYAMRTTTHTGFLCPNSSPFPHNPNTHTQDGQSDDSNIPAASVRKIVDQTLVRASV